MRNWSGNYTFAAARLHRPTSIGEAQRLVAGARHIRAVGTRHSFNGVADSPGDLIDLGAIPADIVIDRERVTATVGAGATYSELALFLQRQGLALNNLASLPHITIAGAASTGTHGSGNRNPCLSAAIAEVEVIGADGALRRIARGEPDFPAVAVALGAFGVMARVTLDIHPTFDVRQDAFVDLPWDDLVENFDAISGAAYSFSVFTGFSGPAADRLWLKTRLDGAADLDVGHLGLRPGSPFRHVATTVDPLTLLNPFGGAPGPWSERLAHFRHDSTPTVELQSEYLIGRAQFGAAVALLRAWGGRIDPLLNGAEIRTVAADDLWLSAAYQRETVGLHFSWRSPSDELTTLTQDLEAALLALGGRPHWGKIIHSDARTLAPLYPRLADFCACARRCDPQGKFRNAFLDRHVFGAAAA